MGARPRQALAVLPRHNTSAARRLGEKLRERAHSRGIKVKSFVSQPGAAGDLYRMVNEVERLARLEAILHLDNGVADAHDFGVHALLLEIGSADRLFAWALRLIGPLISYDAEHRSDLVGTLEAYLRAWGHLAQCASILRVHPNTLKYRLRRIHEILSLNPRDFSARVELLIACYAYRAAQVLDPGAVIDRDVRTLHPRRLTAGRSDQAWEAT
jgi:DNA-binding PucR family transcriptional regulator